MRTEPSTDQSAPLAAREEAFTIGGEAGAAADPVGRASTAQTDVSLRAEMLSWSRSRGAFAGVSLQGATPRQDQSDNADIYGHKLTNKQVSNGSTAGPAEGNEFFAAQVCGAVTTAAT